MECDSLDKVYYDGTIEDWCNIILSNEDSNPMTYANHFYIKNSNNEYEELTEIEIPNTITKIGDFQFCGFNDITDIRIPNSVTSIGYWAFFECASLTSIEISSSVTSIGNCAFLGCISLTNIVIPSNVTRIGNDIF